MVVDVIGYAIGGIGTAVAVYSLYRQKKLEERLKRKEKFREVGEKLKTIEKYLRSFLDIIYLRDLDSQAEYLEIIPMEMIKAHYDTKQSKLRFDLEIYYYSEKGGKKEITNTEEGIKLLKSHETIYCKIRVFQFAHNYGSPLNRFSVILKKIDELTDEEIKIINEFNPGLLSKMEKLILESAQIILESFFDYKQFSIDFPKFKNSRELGEKLFKGIIGYEKLQPKLKEFEQVLEELEELRKDLLKVSYS